MQQTYVHLLFTSHTWQILLAILVVHGRHLVKPEPARNPGLAAFQTRTWVWQKGSESLGLQSLAQTSLNCITNMVPHYLVNTKQFQS